MSLYHQDFAEATWQERERGARERNRNRDFAAVRAPSVLRRLIDRLGSWIAPAPGAVIPALPLAAVVDDPGVPAMPMVSDLVAPIVELARPVVEEVVSAVQAQPAMSESASLTAIAS
jgi:hypothetical protein